MFSSIADESWFSILRIVSRLAHSLKLAEIDESVIAARRSMLLFRNDVIEHQRPNFRVDSRHLSRNNSPG